MIKAGNLTFYGLGTLVFQPGCLTLNHEKVQIIKCRINVDKLKLRILRLLIVNFLLTLCIFFCLDQVPEIL